MIQCEFFNMDASFYDMWTLVSCHVKVLHGLQICTGIQVHKFIDRGKHLLLESWTWML
jgi:hypothetical protein